MVESSASATGVLSTSPFQRSFHDALSSCTSERLVGEWLTLRRSVRCLRRRPVSLALMNFPASYSSRYSTSISARSCQCLDYRQLDRRRWWSNNRRKWRLPRGDFPFAGCGMLRDISSSYRLSPHSPAQSLPCLPRLGRSRGSHDETSNGGINR